MNNYSKTSTQHTQLDLTELWNQLTDDFFSRSTDRFTEDAIAHSVTGMHLTAHLVCGYIGNPHAILRPTMTLPQLAERLRRDTEAVSNCFPSCTVIETFGQPAPVVAGPRWLLALWSLVMDMVTSSSAGTKIEVNLGACDAGYEIEVGHDDPGWMSDSGKKASVNHSLTGRWLESICPEWEITLPVCPLGGYAVQMNIPSTTGRQAA